MSVWQRASPTLSVIHRGNVIGTSRPGPGFVGHSAALREEGGALEFASSMCLEQATGGTEVHPIGALVARSGYELLKMSPTCDVTDQLAHELGGEDASSC